MAVDLADQLRQRHAAQAEAGDLGAELKRLVHWNAPGAALDRLVADGAANRDQAPKITPTHVRVTYLKIKFGPPAKTGGL
jgi:hypothetical protein